MHKYHCSSDYRLSTGSAEGFAPHPVAWASTPAPRCARLNDSISWPLAVRPFLFYPSPKLIGFANFLNRKLVIRATTLTRLRENTNLPLLQVIHHNLANNLDSSPWCLDGGCARARSSEDRTDPDDDSSKPFVSFVCLCYRKSRTGGRLATHCVIYPMLNTFTSDILARGHGKVRNHLTVPSNCSQYTPILWLFVLLQRRVLRYHLDPIFLATRRVNIGSPVHLALALGLIWRQPRHSSNSLPGFRRMSGTHRPGVVREGGPRTIES